MAAYRLPSPPTSRPFVVTAYVARGVGSLRPLLPSVGPCRARDERPCRMGVHHRRERSTGPCFALTVMRCRTHALAFTLYPPGHVPHGRQAVAPVAADGSEVRLEGAERGEAALERWRPTVMAAALDAAHGRAWPRSSRPVVDFHGWASQGRWLHFSEHLLGVASGIHERERLRVATALGLDGLLVREQASRLAPGVGYRARGEAVVRVLAEVERRGCVLAPLLRAGHEAGLWGAPLQWESATGVLRALAFPASGTRPP